MLGKDAKGIRLTEAIAPKIANMTNSRLVIFWCEKRIINGMKEAPISKRLNTR